jgi:hypothetical protein
MDDNKSLGQRVLERAKAKKQTEPQAKEHSEAERLFNLIFPEASHWKADYSQPLTAFDPITYVPYLKEAALAILDTGIIGENGLMDYEGHKEIFHFDRRDLRDLISALVDTHYKYCDVTFSPGDILRHFDNLFESVAVFVRLAGVKDSGERGIKKVREGWREKVSLAVSQGTFPSNWRELTKAALISSWKYRPRTEAQALAIVFLGYAPQARNIRIATWVNAILPPLGRNTVSKSRLRDYIKTERQLRPRLPQENSKNPI